MLTRLEAACPTPLRTPFLRCWVFQDKVFYNLLPREWVLPKLPDGRWELRFPVLNGRVRKSKGYLLLSERTDV